MYRNIKNRTVCFQERFRLLSLAAVLRKHPSWFQNPIDIVFWNRNVCFLRTGRSQNPENKSVLFFIEPRLCSMQYPSCENPLIHIASGRTQRWNSGKCALYHRRITRHWKRLHFVVTSFIGTYPITVSSITQIGRFCGAIHSVDWACISVLSQVIRNVNERKTV